jgi:hypothetical protein
MSRITNGTAVVPTASAARHSTQQLTSRQGHCAHLGRVGGPDARGRAAHRRRRCPRCAEQLRVRPLCRLHRPSACAVRTADSRRRRRDTALCCAAYNGHSATISALVFAGADRDVSNNNGYGRRRGSAWVPSLHAYRLGRETAEKLAEEEGTSDEYQKAVRKVRLVQRLAGRPAKGCAGSGPVPACGRGRQVGLPVLTRASAYRVGIPIISLSPVRRGRAWLKHIAASCCVRSACAAVRATD